MHTAVINIKTEQSLKKAAQKVAAELGLNLSAIINAYLNQLVRTKTINFSVSDEEPSEYLIEMLEKSREDIKTGRVSPAFDNIEDEIAWLNDPNARYQNGDKV